MELIEGVSQLKRRVDDWLRTGQQIGVVPTMGALHAGHGSLVQAARKSSDAVIATLFVNPTQFAPTEDLAKYPRTLESDLKLLDNERVDVVFAPSEAEIYPSGFSTFVEPPEVARSWEGTSRATHFRGVATVVLKLLNLTQASKAYFGQKDFQQVRVVSHMVRDLNVPCEIVTCPTVRDHDGLALSSRNRFLSPNDRKIALAISGTLVAAEREIRNGQRDGSALMAKMMQNLLDAGITQLDYAVVVDPDTLAVMREIHLPAAVLIAARVGSTRLIDNALIEAS